MYSKLNFPICLTLTILVLLFVCPATYAPYVEDFTRLEYKTIADHYYEMFDGTPWQKQRAYAGMIKWPEHFGNTQEEAFDIQDRETAGRFNANAFNKLTHARGTY